MSDVDQRIVHLETRAMELSRAASAAKAQARQATQERDRARADARRFRDELLAISTDAGAGSRVAERVHRIVYGDHYRKDTR